MTRTGQRRTLVFTICNFRGLDCGWSAAPTRAISEVQNSISTIPLAPSSGFMFSEHLRSNDTIHTMSVDTSEWITVGDAVPFPGADRDTSALIRDVSYTQRFKTHVKSWLKLAKSMLDPVRSAMVAVRKRAYCRRPLQTARVTRR